MTAFVDAYDAVFFDLDGVLYLGPLAVEGAVAGVRRLHEAGWRWKRPRYVYVERADHVGQKKGG